MRWKDPDRIEIRLFFWLKQAAVTKQNKAITVTVCGDP
jgi:hypothetical protein